MATRNEQELCSLYITPEERRLLAKVAQGRGVGRDYITLRAGGAPLHLAGRPIPRWLGQARPTPRRPVQRKPHSRRQTRHCRSCAHLFGVAPGGSSRYVCARAVWTQPLLEQSMMTSHRLRALSLTCTLYQAAARPERPTLRHCRACRELVAADTVDERFVCARGQWRNAMKPQSVANARRLARLSAACPHFAPTARPWIARSKSRSA